MGLLKLVTLKTLVRLDFLGQRLLQYKLSTSFQMAYGTPTPGLLLLYNGDAKLEVVDYELNNRDF